MLFNGDFYAFNTEKERRNENEIASEYTLYEELYHQAAIWIFLFDFSFFSLFLLCIEKFNISCSLADRCIFI